MFLLHRHSGANKPVPFPSPVALEGGHGRWALGATPGVVFQSRCNCVNHTEGCGEAQGRGRKAALIRWAGLHWISVLGAGSWERTLIALRYLGLGQAETRLGRSHH